MNSFRPLDLAVARGRAFTIIISSFSFPCRLPPPHPIPSYPILYSLTQPQMTIARRAAQNNHKRASSPAGERSRTSAGSDGRCVPGAPAGRMSSVVVVRWWCIEEEEEEEVTSQSQSQEKKRRGRRSTTCSASGSPCVSVESVNLAWCGRGFADHKSAAAREEE